MRETDEVLARIDEVLGIQDDMTIEHDDTVSGDAMRSRPASEVAMMVGRRRERDQFSFTPMATSVTEELHIELTESQREVLARIYDVPDELLGARP